MVLRFGLKRNWRLLQMTKINLNFEFDDDDGIETSEDFMLYLLDLLTEGHLLPVVDQAFENQRATYH